MTIKIGSNIASLTAQRRLGETNSALSKTFERLASGQRINRASDDAAGLAIADDLKAKGRIYTQGIRNGNDGISLLNIADSAIDALSGVVTRIRELSEQAANGTYSNKQREALDNEAQELSKEFTRITQTTSFNGIKLFDGSLGQGVRLQLGVGISESINASIGGAVGTGDFNSANQFSSDGYYANALSLGDLNGDGILDLVAAGEDISGRGYASVRIGLGNGSFGEATHFSSEHNQSLSLKLGDLNSDGILDIVTAGYNTNNGEVTVRLGLGDGTFGSALHYSTEGRKSTSLSLGDLNGDDIIDLVTAGYDDSITGWATIRLGLGDGNFGSATLFSTEGNGSHALGLGDLNGDGILDLVTAGSQNSVGTATVRLGLGNGLFGTSTQYTTEAGFSMNLALGDLNNDGNLDLVTTGADLSASGYTTIKLGNNDGSFVSSSQIFQSDKISHDLSLGDVNGDGKLDIIETGYDGSFYDFTTVRIGLGNASFENPSNYTTGGFASRSLTLGDLNGDNTLDLITSGFNSYFERVLNIRLARTEDGSGAMLNFSLKTKSDALQSMGMLDRTLENLAKQRGTIGASQSRVNIAISNLQTAKENFAAAESRIRDADVASEAANLARTQILQQAAASVLSQANQQPQLALQLLR